MNAHSVDFQIDFYTNQYLLTALFHTSSYKILLYFEYMKKFEWV